MFCWPQDKFTVCIGPAFVQFQKTGIPFLAPGFAGPLWVSGDPAVGDIIVRDYACIEVFAEYIQHDVRDRTCTVALTSPDYPLWYDTTEVEWSTTWSRMEWIVQQTLGLPPHRTAVFNAGRSPARALGDWLAIEQISAAEIGRRSRL